MSFDGWLKTKNKNEDPRLACAYHCENRESLENKVNFTFKTESSLLWSLHWKNR